MTTWLAAPLVGSVTVTASAPIVLPDVNVEVACPDAFVTLLAAVASSHTWGVRPQMISMLLMALTAWLLTRSGLPALPTAQDNSHAAAAGRRRALWALPALMVLWVNLHGGFVAWLVTLALLVLECGARRAWHSARRYGLLALLCTLASLANPHGWQLHASPISIAGIFARQIKDSVRSWIFTSTRPA